MMINNLLLNTYTMRKTLFYILMAIMISCDNSDDIDDCSLVFCVGGDIVGLVIMNNDQNILQADPPNTISVIQNELPVEFAITVDSELVLLVEDNGPILITIDDIELNMEFASTFIEAECCSGIRIDNITINNSEICDDNESCDEVLEVNID